MGHLYLAMSMTKSSSFFTWWFSTIEVSRGRIHLRIRSTGSSLLKDSIFYISGLYLGMLRVSSLTKHWAKMSLSIFQYLDKLWKINATSQCKIIKINKAFWEQWSVRGALTSHWPPGSPSAGAWWSPGSSPAVAAGTCPSASPRSALVRPAASTPPPSRRRGSLGSPGWWAGWSPPWLPAVCPGRRSLAKTPWCRHPSLGQS